MAIRDGCKRNATKNLIKTANIARTPTLTHVAASQRYRYRRLRLGIIIRENLMKKSLASVAKNYFGLFALIMVINMTIGEQQVRAASMNISRVETVFLKEICSMEVKWENACSGQWENDNSTSNSSRSSHFPRNLIISQYNTFKKSLTTTYNELRSNSADIDTSDMKTTWKTYRNSYRFLPRLRDNSRLKLRFWHRQAKIYVGSFNYLYRAKLYFDLKHTNTPSNLSKTLKVFELAALKILCDIETTINGTSQLRRLFHHINPKRMAEIIKFHTIMKQFYSNTCRAEIMDDNMEPSPVNSIDLKYVKKHFLHFLRAMRKVVKSKIAKLRERNSGSNISTSNSSISTSTSTEDTSSSSIQEGNLSLSESSRIRDHKSIENSKEVLRRHANKRRHHRRRM